MAAHGGGLMQELSIEAVLATLPRDLVNDVLRKTGTASVRHRLLPAPMVVYLVVLLALYSEASVRENLRLLLEPLRRRSGRDRAVVATGAAITKARKRLGAAPFAALFDAVARPVGTPSLPGCFWRGYRVAGADATTVETQDTEANRRRFGRHGNQHGAAGYPQLKAVVLLEVGTHAPLACAWGGADAPEGTLFDSLQGKLTKDMLLLADRAYYDFARWQACARKAGALLWRVRNNLALTPLRRFDDGSYLAEIRPSWKLVSKGRSGRTERAVVRVIEYKPVFADGTEGEQVRLFTTLVDPGAAPAEELARLYPDRWQLETGFDEWKTHLRGPDRILRSPRPDLVEQELYGFLLAYYTVRATMAEAARRATCAPREMSFVHAVRVLRRRLSFPPGGRQGGERAVGGDAAGDRGGTGAGAPRTPKPPVPEAPSEPVSVAAALRLSPPASLHRPPRA